MCTTLERRPEGLVPGDGEHELSANVTGLAELMGTLNFVHRDHLGELHPDLALRDELGDLPQVALVGLRSLQSTVRIPRAFAASSGGAEAMTTITPPSLTAGADDFVTSPSTVSKATSTSLTASATSCSE